MYISYSLLWILQFYNYRFWLNIIFILYMAVIFKFEQYFCI
jgi:hypothetical protein